MHPWRAHNHIACSEARESTSSCFLTHPVHDTVRYCKRINQYDANLVNEPGSMPSSGQERAWQHFNLLDVDFWLWYWKVMPKGMAHAFRIRFWETFNAPRTSNILTDNQYKLPNSNDGCMQLRAPTACPEWNEGDRWGWNNPPLA